jgi:putative phosphoesterase
MRIGLISDTHGRLRPEVFKHFENVDHILHAGDIGDLDILTALEMLAPVTAVFGNVDDFQARARLPEIATLDVEGRHIVVVHGHQLGSPTPALLRKAHPDGDIVIFGHTHRPEAEWIEGRLFVNPGSAGAPRFRLKPTIAILRLGAEAEVDWIEFEPAT